MLPDLIILGYGKCGTTSVFRYLSHSSKVSTSKRKETNFLLENNLEKIIERYQSNYLSQGLRIDASPSYVHNLENLLNTISVIYKQARQNQPILLACSREPLSKVISVFKAAKRSGIINKNLTFSNFVSDSLNGIKPCSGQWGDWLINDVRNSSYHREISLLTERYEGRFYLLDSENIAANPLAVTTELLSLFGIGADDYESFEFTTQNQAITPRSMRLHMALVKINDFLEPTFNKIPKLKQPLVSTYRRYFSKENEESFDSKELIEYITFNIEKTKEAFDRADWIFGQPKWVSKYEK